MYELPEWDHHPLGNDKWAAKVLNMKLGGFFVEAGAGTGTNGSSTYLLEDYLDWNGILIEPNFQFELMCESPRLVMLENVVLWDKDGLVEFVEVKGAPGYSGVLTTLMDRKADIWKDGEQRTFKCTTLTHVLDKHSAPPIIDYVALDTEGSEGRILSGLDFNRYQVRLFSIEDDTCNKRLLDLGYKQVQNEFCPENGSYERYFVKEELLV